MPLVLDQRLSDPACQVYSWEISTAFRALRLDEHGPFRDAYLADVASIAERGMGATLEELLAS
jgi:hypothetical protein